MNRTLLSLAIIRTNWKQYQHDYIQIFIPLFATLIKQKNYDEISLEKIDIIRNDFKNDYGLDIPSNPIQTILNKLSKKKYIIRENNKFIPNHSKLGSLDISEKSSQITREFEHVISSLQAYIRESYKIEFETTILEGGLIAYLKKHDLDLLFAAEKNSLLPKIQPNQKLQYLINDFIGNAFRRDPQLFKFIQDLTIGHALSATILFDDFSKYSGKLKGLNLFLDSPFIFNLLGINGDLKKSLAEELILILNDEGANLFVLEISQIEVTTNLEEALKLLERGKKDPTKGTLTYRECLENGIDDTDIEQIILNMPEFYKKYQIEHNVVPNYDEFREFQIDEEKLYDTIIETYDGIISPSKQNGCGTQKPKSKEKDDNGDSDKLNNTIYRDVQVLSGIYRYRLGNNPKTLKDCKYLFITTNSSLAHASRRFEKREQKQRYSLPTCLTDVFLGTLIWLHSPAKLESLNEKKIIADSYAALKPDTRLIARYLEEVEKLKKGGVISQENYILLRTHRAAINILENKTLGDINEFNSQTTEEILEELIAQLKGEEREKLLHEQEQHAHTQNQLDAIKKQLYEFIEGNKIREQEEVRAKLDRTNRVQRKSEKKARCWINTSHVVLIVLLSTSLTTLAFSQLGNLNFPDWILIVTTSIVGLLSVFSWLNIASIRERIRFRILNYYKNKYRTRFEAYGIVV